jgi:hypothetical protein
MAFLGIFGKRSDVAGGGKFAERVANKRAQAYERWEAIQALSKLKTPESVDALLARFTFYVEPSITDQEEKDAAFEAVVAAGDAAVAPVCAFLRRADSTAWPIKILDRLLAPDAVTGHLLDLLSSMDTEYERDPERKIQLLTTLAERTDPRVAAVAARFVVDANETARFAAVGVLHAQGAVVEHASALIDCLCAEESVRVRNRIFEALGAVERSVTPREDAVKARLTAAYSLDKSGVPRKRA